MTATCISCGIHDAQWRQHCLICAGTLIETLNDLESRASRCPNCEQQRRSALHGGYCSARCWAEINEPELLREEAS